MNAAARIPADQGFDAPAAQQPPFGAYAPTVLQSLLIGLAENTALGRGSLRWMISQMIEGIRPGTGRCRALRHEASGCTTTARTSSKRRCCCTSTTTDHRELAQLRAAARPGFHFVDVGANAGIYVCSDSRAPDATILAVEANPIYANRLRFNVAANNMHNVTVENAAAGAAFGTGAYYPEGESMADAQGSSFDVLIKPLYDMVVAAGFGRIDAMKMDIEGFEDRVLPPFFENAPRSLWPRLILEAWTGAIRDLCVARLPRAHGRARHEHHFELPDA